jgi:hypothetical protein
MLSCNLLYVHKRALARCFDAGKTNRRIIGFLARRVALHKTFAAKAIFVSILLCSLASTFLIANAMSSGRNQMTIDILAFDGNHISVSLKIFVEGNYSDKIMWVRYSPAYVSSSSGGMISDTLVVEIWQGMSRFYDASSNSTVFSIKYSCNNTYFKTEPSLHGLPVFPLDRYSLTLYVAANFNFTIDDSSCVLPFQNYEGTVISHQTSDPTIYLIELQISHSEGFLLVYSFMLGTVLLSLYGLVGTMVYVLYKSHRRKEETGDDVIKVSSAMMFFVPAFEMALNSLKSPLSLVLSDVFLVPIIPANAAIIIFAMHRRQSVKKAKEPETS